MEKIMARLAPKTLIPRPDAAGGVPELTADVVAMAAGSIRAPVEYHAVMARWVQDRRSEEWLKRLLPRFAWGLWFERALGAPGERVAGRPDAAVTITQISRLSHLALIAFLNPEQHRRMTAEQQAKFVGVGFRAWAGKLRPHHNEVHAWLLRRDANGIREIRAQLRGD